MKNNDYAYCTMTLKDTLDNYPNFLDFIELETETQTNKFKEIFTARWSIYEIGGETVSLSKLFLANRFMSIKDYYQELINDYENKINYIDGIVSTNELVMNDNEDYTYGTTDTRIDLPNRTTQNEYATDKLKRNGTNNFVRDNTHTTTRKGDVNILDQKIKYQKYLKNIYLEFANKFESCFCMVFG